MNPIDSLNPDNANQIKRYLKFLRQKKDAALRSMNNDFADAIEDRCVFEVLVMIVIN